MHHILKTDVFYSSFWFSPTSQLPFLYRSFVAVYPCYEMDILGQAVLRPLYLNSLLQYDMLPQALFMFVSTAHRGLRVLRV